MDRRRGLGLRLQVPRHLVEGHDYAVFGVHAHQAHLVALPPRRNTSLPFSPIQPQTIIPFPWVNFASILPWIADSNRRARQWDGSTTR